MSETQTQTQNAETETTTETSETTETKAREVKSPLDKAIEARRNELARLKLAVEDSEEQRQLENLRFRAALKKDRQAIQRKRATIAARAALAADEAVGRAKAYLDLDDQSRRLMAVAGLVKANTTASVKSLAAKRETAIETNVDEAAGESTDLAVTNN